MIQNRFKNSSKTIWF